MCPLITLGKRKLIKVLSSILSPSHVSIEVEANNIVIPMSFGRKVYSALCVCHVSPFTSRYLASDQPLSCRWQSGQWSSTLRSLHGH